MVRNTDLVTFEATPRIAEKIAVAQTLGALSLSLRSIADKSAELERAIAAGEVQVSDDPNAERTMLAAQVNQPSDSGSSYTVGGEVSRFARRTVPIRTDNAGGAGVPTGPVVRVARGKAVELVPVGAR